MNAETGSDKILITGAGGVLGGDLLRAWRAPGASRARRPIVALRRREFDITDPAACRRALQAQGPAVVVNCAARADVDYCEKHPEEAFAVNAEGPRHLAEACAEHDVKLVHISTDYVFDGTKPEPYSEDDAPSPRSVYSESKAAGEQAVTKTSSRALILRVAWVYGFNDKTFVRTILQRAQTKGSVGVIGDQFGSPTYSFDIAVAVLRLLEVRASGIVHFTNEGVCSRYDMTRRFFVQLGLNSDRVSAIPAAQLSWVAHRPARIELSKDKYRRLAGAAVRSWQEALDDYVRADAQCAALAKSAAQ
jgi:dTDP-4-dehydrorhamnose reductase